MTWCDEFSIRSRLAKNNEVIKKLPLPGFVTDEMYFLPMQFLQKLKEISSFGYIFFMYCFGENNRLCKEFFWRREGRAHIKSIILSNQ